jgi:phosphatidylserine/phosphatidylglycerophosphate/cardiolipin synthase-like enzyme
MQLFRISAFAIALAVGGCAAPPPPQPVTQRPAPRIEAAFSPDAGAEQLVVSALASAKTSIHLAAYTFTSPAVVRALLDAKKRGVNVMVLVDARGNHSKASQVAIRILMEAGIPLRTISVYAIHHDKYAVIDGETVQTGSFNYSKAAAKSNSENVIVVRRDRELASKYETNWQSRWAQGSPPG